jgi:hypothetical protein
MRQHANQIILTDLIELILALLRVVNSRLVAIVEEMAGCDEAITSIVARTTCDEDALSLTERL